MVKTSISPPPPERPENEALLHLNALEAMIKSRKYKSQSDQDADLEHLRMLRKSLAFNVLGRYPRATEGSSESAAELQAAAPGLTQLWQQVITEIAMERRSLGMLLAQQSLLVRIQGDVALVMVKQMWLPSIRQDAALIERELRGVLGRPDLQLSLKAAVADVCREEEGEQGG